MNEIGRRLRAAREAKGLSLEVVEEETKIRRKYVEALEAGQEAVLPGDAYIKGFLRTYGNYLGLDGTTLVEEYKRSKERHEGAHAPASVSAAAQRQAPPRPNLSQQEREERREALKRDAAAVREVARSRGEDVAEPVPATGRHDVAHTQRQRRPLRKESGSMRTLGIAAVVLALIGAVAYLGWVIFSQAAPPKTQPEPPKPTPQTSVTQPEPTPAPKLPDPPKVTMSKANATDVVFAVPAADVVVTVEPTAGGVWLKPAIDGKDQTDGTITKATEYKGKEVRLRMGHMNGVNLNVNGQRFEKPLEGGPYNLIFKGQ